jgi:hypothetical protein
MGAPAGAVVFAFMNGVSIQLTTLDTMPVTTANGFWGTAGAGSDGVTSRTAARATFAAVVTIDADAAATFGAGLAVGLSGTSF